MTWEFNHRGQLTCTYCDGVGQVPCPIDHADQPEDYFCEFDPPVTIPETPWTYENPFWGCEDESGEAGQPETCCPECENGSREDTYGGEG